MNHEARDGVRAIIRHIGDDPERAGLLDTPRRVVSFFEEMTRPVSFDFTVFEAESYDEMIVQTGIQFYSLCEHHLVPFFGTAAVAYIPDPTINKIVGLSKLARVVEHYSRALQNQERLTDQILMHLVRHLQPTGCGVTLTARHLCMEARGVRKPGVETTTTRIHGAFREHAVREEFLSAVRRK